MAAANSTTTPYGRIYCITNAVNGKQYVGQTVRSVGLRWKQHLQLVGRCRALENAIKKYGSESFSIRDVCVAHSQSELDELERQWIADLNTVSPNGYNLSSGGAGAGRMHEETKARMREIAKTPQRLAQFDEMRRRPDVIAKQTAAKKERFADPDWKATTLAAMMDGRTPEKEKLRGEALKRAFNKPGVRERRREISRRNAQNPLVLARQSASLKAAWNALTDEQRRERGAALSVALKGHKKKIDYSPEAKAYRREIALKRAATPGLTEKRVASMAKHHSNPEFLARRGAAIAAGKAKTRLLRTHCKHGHQFTEQSTRINTRGVRECKTCKNIAEANHRRRRGMKRRTFLTAVAVSPVMAAVPKQSVLPFAETKPFTDQIRLMLLQAKLAEHPSTRIVIRSSDWRIACRKFK